MVNPDPVPSVTDVVSKSGKATGKNHHQRNNPTSTLNFEGTCAELSGNVFNEIRESSIDAYTVTVRDISQYIVRICCCCCRSYSFYGPRSYLMMSGGVPTRSSGARYTKIL